MADFGETECSYFANPQFERFYTNSHYRAIKTAIFEGYNAVKSRIKTKYLPPLCEAPIVRTLYNCNEKI